MRLGVRGPSLGAVLLLVAAVALLVLGGGGSPDPGAGAESAADGARGGAGEGEHGAAISAEVVRVVDGDTIEALVEGEEEDVRYIGVDTPETVDPDQPVQCYGHRASEFNASLVEGERVRLVFDAERRDAYGRLLAYVYGGDLLVNAELIRGGYARTLEIEPNTAKAARFERLERSAGRRGIGLWGGC